MRSALEERVIEAIRGSVPAPMTAIEVRLDHHLKNDLGLDSLGLMTLAFRLEDALGLQLAEHTDGLRGAATVEQLVAFVGGLSQRRAS